MSADNRPREDRALPVGERAALARTLLLSLDGDAELGSELTWIEKIDRRARS